MPAQPLSAFLRAANDTDDQSRDEHTALAQRRSGEPDIAIPRYDNGRDDRYAPIPHPVEDEGPQFDHKYEGPNSWYPQNLWEDLADIEEGHDISDTPVWGYREDGQCLIYPYAINWVAGETGHGKTWFALMIAQHVMEDGDSVVYIDFDHNRSSILKRLIDMGTDPETIGHHFYYVKPGTSLADGESRERFEDVLARIEPALVIIDTATEAGVNEGLDLVMNPNHVIEFKRRVLTPITEHAAVLVIDHTSTPGQISRYPGGSKHKLNMVNGAAYVIEQVVPITSGADGSSRVWLAKDKDKGLKPKTLRQHGFRHTEGLIELVGILRADGESRQVADLDVYLDMPEIAVQRLSTPRPKSYPGARRQASSGRRGRPSNTSPEEIIALTAEGLSQEAIAKKVGASKGTVSKVLKTVRNSI